MIEESIKVIRELLQERLRRLCSIEYNERFDELHIELNCVPANWHYIACNYSYLIYSGDLVPEELVKTIIERYRDYILDYFFTNKERYM